MLRWPKTELYNSWSPPELSSCSQLESNSLRNTLRRAPGSCDCPPGCFGLQEYPDGATLLVRPWLEVMIFSGWPTMLRNDPAVKRNAKVYLYIGKDRYRYQSIFFLLSLLHIYRQQVWYFFNLLLYKCSSHNIRWILFFKEVIDFVLIAFNMLKYYIFQLTVWNAVNSSYSVKYIAITITITVFATEAKNIYQQRYLVHNVQNFVLDALNKKKFYVNRMVT